jgi:Spy/CpxP family protein refolding chaperone
MTKAKVILIIAFVVTLAAGVAAGFTLRSLTHHPPRSFGDGPHDPGAPPRRSHFPDLNLTAEQKAKMDEIWNAVRHNSRELQNEQRRTILKQREEAVRAIMTDEQKVKYDAALKDYAEKMAELGKARDKAFQEAREKTTQILTAEQSKKFEEWLKSWREERRPGGPPPEGMEPQRGHAPGGAPPPSKAEEPAATGSGT